MCHSTDSERIEIRAINENGEIINIKNSGEYERVSIKVREPSKSSDQF